MRKMRTPMIILNMKSYREAEGKLSLVLARTCEKVALETGASIAVCPPMVELSRVALEVSIPVLAQNVDMWDATVRTGSTSLGAVKNAGAIGTLVNHSECRRLLSDIGHIVDSARGMGLTTIVCTNNVAASRAAAALAPDMIAMEPPELIGGDISVTTADPRIVEDTVRAVREAAPGVMVLTGAGVKDGNDVRKALELGTVGVLLASGVVKAKDPGKVLLSLAEGLVGRR
ncbi:MAG: triose-phosphate isomerase [Candidatus Thermoplasmatota archaeon]|nr:triose-phosphate isomerase [Candidatus Thermoplasmatota archaeon]